MAKHTPGPWTIKHMLLDEQTEIDTGFHSLPAVYAPYDNCVCELVHHDYSTQAEMEANARLIAAAPDLLAALQALFAESASRFDYVGATPDEEKAMADACAAIQKATTAV